MFRRFPVKRSCLASALALVAVLAASGASAAPAITPLPAHMEAGQGNFVLTARTRIHVPAHDDDAMAAAVWLRDEIAKARGFRLDIVTGEGREGISFSRIETFAATPAESYHLETGPEGARVAAASKAGLFYGAVTLWQMATQGSDIPAVTIDDQPRFQWRGLMIDSCRHFQDVAEIKKIIDAMASQKLNVLQWNLADDQAWRLEIPAYPKLTELTAFRREAGAAGTDPKTGKPILYGGYYTAADVREVVDYARARNIMVVPEIDMPGHATAAITAYPNLGSTGARPAEGLSDWGVYPNLYNVDDGTFVFIDTVLDEVMDLFPSPYIHVGGDEAIKPQWKASPAIQAKIRALGLKNEDELQSWFITRVSKHIASRGRRLIGWDEILQGGVAPDATVMSWRGIQGAIDAAKQGHDTVLSPAPDLYLDNRQSASSDEPPGRGHILDLKSVYAFNPTPDAISEADRSHVLGLQANVWTELIRTDDRFEMMAFPRAVAVAEIGWSPAASHDWTSFVDRLPADLARLKLLGIDYDRVPFEPQAALSLAGKGRVDAALSTEMGIGDIHYATGGKPVTAASPAYGAPLSLPLNTELKAQTFLNGEPLGGEKTYALTQVNAETRNSYQLTQCSGKNVLALEDDYPVEGKRAVILQDVMHPCWSWKGVDTSRGLKLSAHIANYPFNFQLADALAGVKFDPPKTPEGELEVRLDNCATGTVVLSLPIGKAAKNPDVSLLVGTVPATPGVHDLCFAFTQKAPAPEWALDDVRLSAR
jgi:hexosaminidase